MTLHQKTVRNNATFVTHLVRYCLMNHLENSLRPCTFIGNKLASPPPIKSYKSECQWNISTDTKGHIMSNIFLQVCQTSFYKWHCWSKNKMVCVGGGFLFLWRRGGGIILQQPHIVLVAICMDVHKIKTWGSSQH